MVFREELGIDIMMADGIAEALLVPVVRLFVAKHSFI